ncbi:uncharacterized protein LOC135834767 isoform X1 [Planococcus citri]|uniref:uncharacterized protein LOC135834767 isoform X1 n=1 Tax=Planococcus citri TaxID=170843 RepID=UPI0031FA4448
MARFLARFALYNMLNVRGIHPKQPVFLQRRQFADEKEKDPLEIYKKWQNNPESVDECWRNSFEYITSDIKKNRDMEFKKPESKAQRELEDVMISLDAFHLAQMLKDKFKKAGVTVQDWLDDEETPEKYKTEAKRLKMKKEQDKVAPFSVMYFLLQEKK